MPKQAFIIAFGVIIYLLVFRPSGAEAYAQGELGYNSLTLPANTPVKLIFHEGLDSQRNREGDEVTFAIAEDVVIMGKTYLCARTPVIGRVKNAKPAKSWAGRGRWM